jgi:hypothetical protein
MLQGIQLGMVIVIAAHKEKRAGCFFQDGCHLWVIDYEMVTKAQDSGVVFTISLGRTIQLGPVSEDAQSPACRIRSSCCPVSYCQRAQHWNASRMSP